MPTCQNETSRMSRCAFSSFSAFALRTRRARLQQVWQRTEAVTCCASLVPTQGPNQLQQQGQEEEALHGRKQLSLGRSYARVALGYSRFGRGQKQSHVARALYLHRGQTSYSSKGRRKKHYMVGSNAVEEVLASLLSVPSGSRDLSL